MWKFCFPRWIVRAGWIHGEDADCGLVSYFSEQRTKENNWEDDEDVGEERGSEPEERRFSRREKRGEWHAQLGFAGAGAGAVEEEQNEEIATLLEEEEEAEVDGEIIHTNIKMKKSLHRRNPKKSEKGKRRKERDKMSHLVCKKEREHTVFFNICQNVPLSPLTYTSLTFTIFPNPTPQ